MTTVRSTSSSQLQNWKPAPGSAPAIGTTGERERGRWSDVYLLLDGRLRALQRASMDRSGSALDYLNDCLDGLESLRDALYELHVIIVDERLRPWMGPGSSLVAYFSAAHVFAGDVLFELDEIVRLESGALRETKEADLTSSATAYILTFLDPLMEALRDLCARAEGSDPDHPLRRTLQGATRVQSEIVALSRELACRQPQPFKSATPFEE